ncbi:MAG: universal stress protein [Desulfobulbaceae bacterium]|nr:universal stress protein [Desulfobulbaceae bacterium]
MQPVTQVLTPIDFSDNAATILRAAAYVAGTFKAELHLVFVVQNFEDYSGFFVPPVNLPNLEEELFASAQQQMDAFVAEHKQHCLNAGVTNVSSKVLAGDVGEEVVKYADQKNIQLIVMGTHGYKGLERIMFGSVAEKVVKTAPCAVLTINPYRDLDRGGAKA